MDSELPRHQGRKYYLVFLGKHKKRALAVVFFVLEAISVVVDQLGKSKWGFLLAAVIISALSFLITIYPVTKGGALAASKPKAERQLLVVEIVFSVIQLMATMAHYSLTVWGVKKNYNALVFPLAFAVIAVVFVFLKDEEVANSSHDQTHSNSSREDSHAISISSTIESVASGDPNNENRRVNMRPRRPHQSQNIEVYMLDSGARISIDLTTVTGYEDLYKKVAETFNTAEGFFALRSIWRFSCFDQSFSIVRPENESWEQFSMVVRKIFIYQGGDGEESGGSEEYNYDLNNRENESANKSSFPWLCWSQRSVSTSLRRAAKISEILRYS